MVSYSESYFLFMYIYIIRSPFFCQYSFLIDCVCALRKGHIAYRKESAMLIAEEYVKAHRTHETIIAFINKMYCNVSMRCLYIKICIVGLRASLNEISMRWEISTEQNASGPPPNSTCALTSLGNRYTYLYRVTHFIPTWQT